MSKNENRMLKNATPILVPVVLFCGVISVLFYLIGAIIVLIENKTNATYNEDGEIGHGPFAIKNEHNNLVLEVFKFILIIGIIIPVIIIIVSILVYLFIIINGK